MNLNIQEMTARSARKDLDLEALISTIATLNNRVVEPETPHPKLFTTIQPRHPEWSHSIHTEPLETRRGRMSLSWSPC